MNLARQSIIEKLFICTDLDRTLLPNGRHPESPEARSIFGRLVSHPRVCLAYVSGRNLALVEAAIQEYHLPLPNWIVGDVGSTIYQYQAQFQDQKWQYHRDWEHQISGDWQGRTADELGKLFADLTVLTLQEPSKQNPFKLSYYMPLSVNYEALKEVLQSRLSQERIAASLIYSVDEAIALLDILPPRATKLHAIEFLMNIQGFDYGNTVFAGDSGNDLPVLVSAVPAIVVANANPEVIAQAQKSNNSLYVAKGGFGGMNGNYSAGILEGTAYYYPFTEAWMQ